MSAVTVKTCTKCGTEKPEEAFLLYYDKRFDRWARKTWCRPCSSSQTKDYRRRNPERIRRNCRRSLLRQYGLTPEDYDRMFREQGGRCAVCSRPPSAKRSLNVDHDHKTGRVRGLLCGQCNVAIGLLQEDPNRIQQIINYLDR